MRKKNLLFILIVFIAQITFSQEMKEGFTYLETGKYKKAEVFFKQILEDFPTNKTAKLCYGRAVGLNGNATKATTIFTELLDKYPSDFEVKLNYAESLLWGSQFQKAKSYYKNLVDEDDQSFSALLGYANTLSNLKEYEDALVYVNKALKVSPGNLNALVSKKYMRLGLANSKVTDKEYDEAERILNENFKSFKNDKETLLNLANLYLISNQPEKAKEAYKTLGLNPKNKLISLNGIALAHHINGKEKLALATSELALASITESTNETEKNQTKERYIQALIWNNKYSLAKSEIDELFANADEPENWMLSLRATLNIYKSDFKKSIEDYNLILENDSASFDGNLGKANALKASGFYKNAYKSANNTLDFYKKQKDATQFIKTLDKQFTPFVETKAAYSFDNGNNKAYSYTVNSELPLSTKFKLTGSYNYRTTSNNVLNLDAKSNNILLGASYQLLNNLTLNGSLGFTSSEAENNSFNQLLADVSVNIKPFKLQDLSIGYKRDIQNFNAELIDREIVQNNYILNYSLNTNFNLGWFTQYYYTSQNDGNTRNLLFTSLYYNILKKPSLKGGFNYQNISFKNQVPTIYFSPSKFHAVEVFINLIKDENAAKEKEWFYGLTAATGFQFIEDDERQGTYRIQTTLGYKFSERSLLNFYGTRSNIASATAAGFTFTEVGLRFKWYFLGKPIYKK
ncbi:tetratricopeptide repeat protein [Polaribacter dokdonensis]|uniref:Tetratricopeptide TPR_2 repeat-containing protein n=1 Tax=Polaribacter dokdonensis DSW-5 TaxID=1300348 RepID=A0A0M9CIT7_9FLAO|nr:tetratricopeptide repeat protein [Polaribacter dokdonensis]KOY52855.1 Tetratricopeptide TPR_2 repeat-containing protein [Polaribacter dokdonensis DSW-5]SEE53475.1 Tetratricopeptide repeat-containing protein [Polaribacter dokdonensis DSW-5]